MNSNFCVHPWTSIHYRREYNGKILASPCCLIRKDIECDSIEEYYNSDYLKSLKSSFTNNEIPTACERCSKQELAGIESKRQKDTAAYYPIFKLKFEKNTNPTHFLEYKIRLGNYCNLRCTTCSGYFSSSWITEDQKFLGISQSEPIKDLVQDSIWDNLKQARRTIGSIEFIGGEPTMISVDQQLETLEYLVETGDSKHINLSYTTNGTRYPAKQSKFFKNFKNVYIGLSVDGVNDKYNYLRYPGKWQDFCNTVDQYCQARTEISQLHITLDYTLSLLNILDVESIRQFAKEKNVNLFYGTGLINPRQFSLFFTDPRMKQWLMTNPGNTTDQQILGIIKTLDHYPSENLLKEFIDRLEELDNRRSTSWTQTFPILAEQIYKLTT